MRIATWNVNSLKHASRVSRSGSVRGPDVLCLQETKLADETFPRRCRSHRSATRPSPRSAGQWNGVAIPPRGSASTRSSTGLGDEDGDPYEGDAALLAAECGGVRVVSRVRAERARGRHRVLRTQARWLAQLRRLDRRDQHAHRSGRRARRLQRRARGPRRVVSAEVRRRHPRHRARARRRRATSRSGVSSTPSAASTTTTASTPTGTTGRDPSTSTRACGSI